MGGNVVYKKPPREEWKAHFKKTNYLTFVNFTVYNYYYLARNLPITEMKGHCTALGGFSVQVV
jgi:hypothetical protein